MSQMDAELKELLVYANTDRLEVDAVVIVLPANVGTFHLTSDYPGYSALDENSVNQFFEYVPMTIEKSRESNDLGFTRQLTIQDLNETIKPLVDLIPIDIRDDIIINVYSYIKNEFGEVGTIKEGPFALTASDLSFTSEGVGFIAGTNQSTGIGTGEVGDLTRVEFLKQFA